MSTKHKRWAWLKPRPSFRFSVRGAMGGWGVVAVLLGLLASGLIVLAIGVNYGYWPTSLADNLTAPELGVLGAIAIAGAAASAYMEEEG